MINIFILILICFLYFVTNFSRNKFKRRDILFLFLCFFLFFFIVGFRSVSTGNDTISYLKTFFDCSKYKWDYLEMSRFEDGFVIFEIIISDITKNGRLFLIILSFIFNVGMYSFIRDNSKDYFMSIILYVFLLFFYSSMTMIRQFFAIVIILYSFRFIKEKKILKYILCVVLAMQFHITSFVCFLLYPLYYMKFSRKKVLLLSVLSIVLIVSITTLSTSLMSLIGWDYIYDVRILDYSLANFLYFLVYLFLFLFSTIMLKGKYNTNHNSFYIYIFFISAIVNFIAMRMNVLARVSDYFTIFTIVALPNVISQIDCGRQRLNFKIIFTILFLIYASVITINRPEWNSAFNYRTCISDSSCMKVGG